MTWLRTLIVALLLAGAAACAGTESGNPSAYGNPRDGGDSADDDDAGRVERVGGDGDVHVGSEPGDTPAADAGTAADDNGR